MLNSRSSSLNSSLMLAAALMGSQPPRRSPDASWAKPRYPASRGGNNRAVESLEHKRKRKATAKASRQKQRRLTKGK